MIYIQWSAYKFSTLYFDVTFYEFGALL
jgi:hypothetical protein